MSADLSLSSARPRRKRPARGRALVGAMCLVALSEAGAAEPAPSEAAALPVVTVAEDLSYNPDTCTTPADGKVYVRLYPAGIGFAVPYRSLGFIDGRPVEDRGPLAVPGDPEGCPGNPIVTRVITFNYHYEALKADRSNPRLGWRPNRMQIFGRRLEGPQAHQERRYKLYCELAAVRETLPEVGLSLCRGERADTPDQSLWLTAYKASYPDLGIAAYFDCVPFSNGVKHCGGQHPLGENFFVAWNVSSSTRRPLAEADLPAFDLSIRENVLKFRAPDIDSGVLNGSW